MAIFMSFQSSQTHFDCPRFRFPSLACVLPSCQEVLCFSTSYNNNLPLYMSVVAGTRCLDRISKDTWQSTCRDVMRLMVQFLPSEFSLFFGAYSVLPIIFYV